ncbi:MAG: c-type cytochrome biogenesis protein CcmI, partial [Thermogutta sp.]|nr:c-type cytochrome biogenesis protein CcmI [Thermogutta sp.]
DRAAGGGPDRSGRAWPWWIAAVVAAALVIGVITVAAYRR